MVQTSRDSSAGLKLLGGLVRLGALYPDGFTAAQLSDHAKVEPETARAFLNPEKGPGFAEVIPGAKSAAAGDGRGRPANLYRLRPDRRAELMQQLVDLRRELDTAIGIPDPALEQVFAPLDLLEATIAELERGNDPIDAWRERLAEARLELSGATADLQALRTKGYAEATPFGRRLEALQARLATVERLGFPPAVKPLVQDPVNALVERLGKWIGGAPKALEPVVVLLNGIRDPDPLTSAIVKFYQDMRVAVFDVAEMEPSIRARLYATLDKLRIATPLAISDFMLAVDGDTSIGQELASEFRILGQPGSWQERAKVGDGFSNLNLASLRRFYVAKTEALRGEEEDPARAAFGIRLTSALTAFDTADAALNMPRHPYANAKEHQARWRSAAQELMGDVVCLDTSANATIAAAFEGVPVDYILVSSSSGLTQQAASSP